MTSHAQCTWHPRIYHKNAYKEWNEHYTKKDKRKLADDAKCRNQKRSRWKGGFQLALKDDNERCFFSRAFDQMILNFYHSIIYRFYGPIIIIYHHHHQVPCYMALAIMSFQLLNPWLLTLQTLPFCMPTHGLWLPSFVLSVSPCLFFILFFVLL